MIKNILKTARGFSPVELVIMVGFAALAAGALIFLATTPHYMAQQPVDINIKVEGAASVSKGVVATTTASESRATSVNADETVSADTETDDLFPGLSEFGKTAGASVTSRGLKIGQVNPAPGHIKGAAGKPARGGETEIFVYPMSTIEETTFTTEFGTYDGYLDSVNVQWAVDNAASGGTVKLMTGPGGSNKVFFFGDEASGGRDYVEIHSGVTVKGETLSADAAFELPDGSTITSDRTVIYGGGNNDAALSFDYGALTILSNAKVVIEDLRFDSFGVSAIHLATCNGAEIRNNKITNVRPLYHNDSGIHWGFGIIASNMNRGQWSGDIYIEDNKLDIFGSGTPYYPVATQSGGILISYSTATAKFYVKNNEIKNPGVMGMGLFGYENTEVWFEGNDIYQRNIAGHTFPWGIGIVSYPHYVASAGFRTVPIGKLQITDNDLYGTGKSVYPTIYISNFSSAIPTKGSGNTVKNNRIHNVSEIAPSRAVIQFRSLTASEISNNTISGSSPHGIRLQASDNITINIGSGELTGLTVPSNGYHVVLDAGSYANTLTYPSADSLKILDLRTTPPLNTKTPY